MFLLVNNGKVLCFSAQKKNQMILLKKNIFHKYWSLFCGRSIVFTSINQSINQSIYLCQYVGWVCLNHPHQRLMYETYDNKLTFVKFCLPSVVIIDHSETNRPTRTPDQILERLNITRMEFLLLRHRHLSCEMSLTVRGEERQLFS